MNEEEREKRYQNSYLIGLLSDVLRRRDINLVSELKEICNKYNKKIAQKMILGMLTQDAKPDIAHNELVRVSYKIWQFFEYIREGSDLTKLIDLGY